MQLHAEPLGDPSPETLKSQISIPYNWQAGRFLGRFFEGLKKAKLLASVCPKCRRKSLPPKRVCKKCFTLTDQLAEVPNRGKLETFAVLDPQSIDEFRSPNEGRFFSTLPQTLWGIVRFEECDSGMVHYLNPELRGELSAGMPMHAVFDSERKRDGTILAIKYFDRRHEPT